MKVPKWFNWSHGEDGPQSYHFWLNDDDNTDVELVDQLFRAINSGRHHAEIPSAIEPSPGAGGNPRLVLLG
jgi:hypothetical protein